MRRLRILTLCTIVAAASIFLFKKRSPCTVAAGDGLVIKREWLAVNKTPLTPAKDMRPADQTFLTFPEWYLVFSPEEQAHYFRQHTATTFPFMSHVAQIWQSYKIVNDQIKDNFPVNKGYHFMIWVIGSSATAEYAIKAWYETVIGRLTDTHNTVTAEDAFNATYTRDYVDFIKERPWYEFNFTSRLKTLWSGTSLTGGHFLRKMERRYILTSELLVKAGYGKLIGLGTKSIYDEAKPTTAVVLASGNMGNMDAEIRQKFADGSALVNLPRYDKFCVAISALAARGCTFKEIAGNNSAILLTVLVPASSTGNFDSMQTIFTQPISSEPQTKRIALTVPVAQLNKLLLQLGKDHIRIEHVFDY